MTTPIADFVARYARAGVSRLHMPGHKGQPFLGCEALDITEIAGADELYEAEGIIAESEANAARLFGAGRTFYSTEGSSQCVRAMLFLALQMAPQQEGRPVLLAARNAHKALLYAAALLDLDIRWLWPAAGQGESLCSCPVTAEGLRGALAELAQEGRRPFGVYVTSPDYLGGMQDLPALASVCREAGTPLLVDNAHGAYLPFLPGGSLHPMALGASLCCDSGHKTLPVLTGGAYLHLAPGLPLTDETVRGALCLFGSTSPSYLILQSLDLCNRYISEGCPDRLAGCVRRLEALRAELNAAGRRQGRPLPPVRPSEPLKLVLDGKAFGQAGRALAEELRRHRVECEFADDRYCVLMFTPENPEQDWARVRSGVLGALKQPPGPAPDAAPEDGLFAALEQQAVQQRTIREAVFAPQEQVPVRQALGRVCAMPAVSCPPAIPIAVSGERIGPAAAALFERYGIENVAVVKPRGSAACRAAPGSV